MSVPVILVLTVPLAGAGIVMLFGDGVPTQSRLFVFAAAAAGLGGAAWGAVRSISGSTVAWRGGFAMDPIRGILVFGALLVSAAALARAERAPTPSHARAGIFAATAASIAPLVVTGSHLLVVAIPVGSAGIALASYAAAGPGARLLHAARAVAGLALSDALALVAIGLAIGKGTAFPPRLSTLAASLLLAAAFIRLGLVPVGPSRDANDTHAATGLLMLGPIRAQGLLFAIFAVGADRGVAYAAAALAVLSIVIAASTMTEPGREQGITAIGAGVALLGFALGGATPTWGAALAVVATFAGTAAWGAGGGWSALARGTAGALPAGGLVAAATLVVGSTFGVSASEPWFLALALPAITGLLIAVARIWSTSTSRNPSISSTFAGAVGVAAGLALAALPVRSVSWLGEPVARSLGVGRLLTVGGEPGIAASFAVIVIGVAAIAFLVGPGRTNAGAPPAELDRPAMKAEADTVDGPASSDVRRWAYVAMFLFAVSLGVAVRVYVSAAGRGFL